MKTDRNDLMAKLKEIESKNLLLEEKIKNNEKKFNENLNEMKAKNEILEQKLINKSNEFNSKNLLLEEEIKTIKRLEFAANNKLRVIESKPKSSEITRIEKELNEINAKIWLPDLKNDSKNGLEVILSAQNIYFGTHLTPFSRIGFSFGFLKSLVCFSINSEFKKSKDCENYENFSFNIRELEELKFCSDSEFPVIIMKLKGIKTCDKIRKYGIKLTEPSKGWFDIQSKGLFEINSIILKLISFI
jgi:hypothetical protein